MKFSNPRNRSDSPICLKTKTNYHRVYSQSIYSSLLARFMWAQLVYMLPEFAILTRAHVNALRSRRLHLMFWLITGLFRESAESGLHHMSSMETSYP